MVAAIKAQDQAFYDRLRKAGFLYDFGADGGGFFSRGTQDPSGFYIDMGTSELIIDGRVAVRSGVSVEAIRERSVVLSDGTELPADVIVYATGYEKFATLGKVLPEEISASWVRSEASAPGFAAITVPGRERPATFGSRQGSPASGREFWADAVLLTPPRVADQGPPCRITNAGLWTA